MALTAEQVKTETRRYMQKVYGWMFFGLLISAGIALYTAMTPSLYRVILGNRVLYFGIIIGQVALIFLLFWLIPKIRAWLAVTLFLLYCVATGFTLSVIFVIYTTTSIALSFGIAAVMFGSMSVYGFFTKTDLTSIGSILVMGLWGLVIAMVVNFFMKNEILHYVVSAAGVVIFTGLTAYDTQKIKNMNIIGNEGTEEDLKEAVTGAAILYLDFINLFLFLLRLVGRRR